jgi:cell division protein FtsB
MNEGIWMSHENLDNLEQTLAGSEESAAASQQLITSKESEIAQLKAENERLTGSVTSLQAKVNDLEGSAGMTTETVKEEDTFDNGAKSQNFAHNEWADQMLGR